LALFVCATIGPPASAAGGEPDWEAAGREAAELLSQYIRIDTRNPPGRTVEAVEFLASLLGAAGLEVERLAATPEKPILVGRLRGSRGGGKPIVLLNHMDVVPADEGEWSFPPWSGQIEGGMVRGRGALDMKGFAIVQLLALRLLVERGERPGHDVLFLSVPDEEVGGAMGTAWLDQNRPDLMDAAAVWDEGGVGLTGAFSAPIVMISVTEKAVLWLKLVVDGPPGHGSRPFDDAAPLRLHRALESIFADPPAPRLTPVARQALRRIGSAVGGMEGFAMRRLKNPLVWLFADGILQQDPLTRALVRDTIALTILRSGHQPNVIPGRAEAVLDCRLLPDTNPSEFVDDLRDTIDDPGVRIEILQPAQTAPASPSEHPMFEAIEAAAQRVHPGAVTTPFMALTGSDARFFRRRGVPAYGFMPFLITQEIAATAHGLDERLPVDQLGPAIRIVYEALRRM
jgi:acetylornithine deacetylase/succinyl-diaminopimelate desuccinylase-like protein